MTPGFIRGNLRTRRALASLGLITAFLFAVALSATPRAHEWVHPDAPQAHHHCGITLLASGSTDLADDAPLTPLPHATLRFSKSPELTLVPVASVFLGACIFEHAPPALV